jgi:hexosaminidase
MRRWPAPAPTSDAFVLKGIIMSQARYRLETRWTPARDGAPPAYQLRLDNRSDTPLRNFRLCVSGPSRIDPGARVEGATLAKRISNHAEFAPPEGFLLAPGESWTISAEGGGQLLRHWNDGAGAAYLVLADGTIAEVATGPTVATGQNAPLRNGTQKFPVPAVAPVPVSIIPWPEEVAVAGRAALPAGLDPRGETAAAQRAVAAFAELTGALFPAEGMVRKAAEGGVAVRLAEDERLGPESYRIGFGTDIAVHAASETGFLYGLITLGQIWRGARQHPATFSFPASGEINDAPEYEWRGSHLDVARQFYASAEVSQFVRLMAWNKLNRFHWHLSDDEAWRVEIDAYPDLTGIGAWRGHGLKLPPLLGSGAAANGGYYSKAAIREIVALAGRLGIAVVPEIDVPGHCYAMLEAIPELRDPGEHGLYYSVQGFPNNSLNPAHEKTYAVLETVFDELIELFPAKIFHIGADEVPLGAWSGSPLALAKLREIGSEAMAAAHAARLDVLTNAHGADEIEGSGAAALQAIFLGRIQAFLASRGCLTGGWQEAAHGDVIDKAKSYLVGWRTIEVSAALAGAGYDMVVSPGQAYYLDMSQGTEWSEPGAGWAGWSSVEKTYSFEPASGWSVAEREHLIGVQACIWSEPMADRAIFDRLVFPRLSAIAEAGWTDPGQKSWARFSALCSLMPNLYGHWSE